MKKFIILIKIVCIHEKTQWKGTMK